MFIQTYHHDFSLQMKKFINKQNKMKKTPQLNHMSGLHYYIFNSIINIY